MVGVAPVRDGDQSGAKGMPLEGAKTLTKFSCPPKNPGQKTSGPFVAYDNQIRSMLQTDQHFPSIGSKDKDSRHQWRGSVMSGFGPRSPRCMKQLVKTRFRQGPCVAAAPCMGPRKLFDKDIGS